ncbi:MAG TPA: N-acetyl-gamma-glutamyl-phosphate reductase [Ktedonobacterales bacterium]|jgi:N-acetyl-gamma-glutamyl-phosphate reductase
MAERVPVAIINVTSYTGCELVRLLLAHPTFQLCEVTARSAQGQLLSDVFPHLPTGQLAITEQVKEAQLVFACLPHGAAAEVIPGLLAEGRRVVDLSADFRLRDADIYAAWYKHTHPCPELLKESVYGLCELHRDELREARLVGNPGCYPTATILALAPALAKGIIKPDIIVDAKSGMSGAGRSLSLTNHYSEMNESMDAYGLEGHRHTPEMEQELVRVVQDGDALRFTFIPHHAPMTRGILATCYADLLEPLSEQEVRALYEDFYAGSSFVRLTPRPPATKWTAGSNSCLLYPTVEPRTQRLIVISCIDNLIKGASGQALQCANILCGLPEEAGLTAAGMYP